MEICSEQNSKVPDIYLTDAESPNDMTSNDQEKAEKLSDFFASVFTDEVEGVWELANKPDIKHKLVIHIDEEVVSKKLAKLKQTPRNLPVLGPQPMKK